MPNLNAITDSLNWKIYHKRQLSFGIEFETEDKYIELTYERFQEEWEEVAEISIDKENLREHWSGPSHMGSFLYFVTNDNAYGNWAEKFSKPFEEDVKLSENSLSAWELSMKKPNARSTSVGDIYHDLDKNLYFMIMGVGWKQIRMKSKVDADSARPQTKTYQEFPKDFGESNKMWKAILKKYYPDYIGVPVYGMNNRGLYKQLAHAIYKHTENGKYEKQRDLENWASSMEPIKNPNSFTPTELQEAEAFVKNQWWKFDSYQGTDAYVNLYQGGDDDARFD